uniref:CubicO group peptidase, beta-lactamase class C family n=1 Tax=Candidatus Kentrum eta TaxID=2126337 RepID=A0A450UY31_9GAMM|nr:MAG: CubicO group peptidase, beta-lactamase class C family [Candidatus Kentron sp. H]VFJ91145.1 MAG: CubicO group peptidase, beta-lactamase class C family [Candidatus Kentron sp. H]VFJ97464.1 MAG: CubicO group peptidase, beta-lactamase class C family [Candidatus Kentron sp. H]
MTVRTTSPEAVGMSSQRLARIAPGMQRWIDRGVIVGADMRVARRGKVVYAEQVGQLDRERGVAMPDDALFRIYSMTKPIVCTALMTLYEEGYFQLITPAGKFIPALDRLKVLQRDPTGALREEELLCPITVGDLLKHTAGFTYDFLEDSPVSERYRQARLNHNAHRTLEAWMRTLLEIPLAYQPGTRWHYSVATDVAAHLIEVLTDRPLRDVLQERIFAPLGMVDTDFCVPEDKLPRLAAMYGVGDIVAPDMTQSKLFADSEAGVWGRLDVDRSYPVDRPETFARGGHGLFSTTRDYLRFALMLLGGGALDDARILGRKTTELMHVNHIPREWLPLMIGEFPMYGYGYGLGSRTMLDIGTAGIPSSVGEFGLGGVASTYYWVDPVEEFVGVFMTQYQGMEEPRIDFHVLAYQAIV